MPEVTAGQAAQILHITKPTLLDHVNEGRLPARRQGLNRAVFVEIDDLRQLAENLGYRFNEELAKQFIQ